MQRRSARSHVTDIRTRRHQNRDSFSNQRSTKSSLRHSVTSEMKPERADTCVNSVEYVIGEDDSLSSDDDEEKTRSKLADPESDGGSSSTDDSSDSSKTPRVVPSANSSMCASCGRGPYRSMKLHLLHCSGVRVKYQCSLCKELFASEAALHEHYMPLYSCDVCGQVFSQQNSYSQHPCPKGTRSALVLFCSESMPHACKICKSFFTTEKTLSQHVSRVHTSVVSTKVCIITNLSALAGHNGTPGAQPAISQPQVANQVLNGKLHTGSPSTTEKSCPSSLSAPSSHPSRPPALISAAVPVGQVKDGTPGRPAGQPSSVHSASDDPDSAVSAAIREPAPPPMPTIMAMFENDSQDVALMKRMNMGWRSKPSHPCRQCGAILRQPSLIISHRYLHRGPRSHRCQCGRAFRRRLHLLRHCVQHAEAVSYICVSCGESFTGATLLAEHMRGTSRNKTHLGRKRKRNMQRKCRMSFTCHCGRLFFRPSTFIWHQLQNRTTTN